MQRIGSASCELQLADTAQACSTATPPRCVPHAPRTTVAMLGLLKTALGTAQ